MAAATAATKGFGTAGKLTASQHQQAFTTLGAGALILGGTIVAGFAAAGKAAIDFESSFAGVRKTVDASETEFAALSQGMRDLATEIPVNVNELNRIGEAAGQLGIKNKAILGFTEVVAKMGVTTDLTSDQAANAFARIGNIMGTAQTDFDRMGSTIVELGNKGAATESEIVEFGLRIAGAGQIAGLAESDVLSIGEAMASVGVQAEAGGTAVQKVLLSITDAVNTGGAKLKLFAETAGLSAQEFADTWQADPAEAFTAFVEGLGASGQDAMGILKELGLTDQRLIRSFLALSGAGDNLRESIERGNSAWKENSALNEEAAKRFGTTASQIQIAKNRVNDLAIAAGMLLAPAIAAVAKALGDFAGFINDLPGPLKASAVGLLGVVGLVSVFAGGLLILLPRIAQAKIAMTTLGLSVKGMAAAAGSSFLWVTAAVAAIDDLSHSLAILRGDLELTDESGGGLAVGFTDLAVMFGVVGEETDTNSRNLHQMVRALDSVQDVLAGVATDLEAGTTAWASHSQFVEKTGRSYHRFAGMSLEDFNEWRGEVVGSLDGVSNALGLLAGDMNVTAAEWDRAMRKTLRVLTNYEDNLRAVEKRDIPAALLQQIVSMGTEGAGVLELLAKASDKEFKKMVGDLRAVEGGTKDLGAAIRELPDKPTVHYGETGLDEMLAKVERYSAAIREMPAAVSTSFQGSSTGKRPADFGAVVQGPATVQIGNIRELVHFTPLSGPGATAGRFSGHVTVDLKNGRGWLELTLDDMARRP